MDTPESADIILFAEGINSRGHARRLVRHPLVKRFPHRCFCHIEHDNPIHVLPGLYATAPRGVSRFLRHTANGGYLVQYPNEFVTHERSIEEDDALFSFIGSMETAKVRLKLLDLNHPRGVVKDVSAQAKANRLGWSAQERAAFRRNYAKDLTRCKFILCPRGLSPSSVRMYEAMRAGRVPVILSDAWVPPIGPDWSRFSLRVSERDIHRLPALLEEMEPDAAAMGDLARSVWDEWFAEDVQFDRIVHWIEQIAVGRRLPVRVEKSLAMVPRYAHLSRQKTRYAIGLIARLGRSLLGTGESDLPGGTN